MKPRLEPPSLRGNIAALGIVQFSNYIIPLITLPYLTRVLGAEAFGKVAFAQAVMTYFVLLVDYSFSWSATRKVSAQRADRDALSRTFAATWAAQWLLVTLAALAATAVVLLTDRLRPDALLYAAAFSTVIGTALFPIWFLQGLERLQVVAVLQLLTRTLALLPIFFFIRQPQDAMWVLLIQGSGAILGGVLALYWMQRESLITWQVPSWANTFGALREGGALFGSRVCISLYTTLVPLILGWVAGPVALAYFNLADKLRTAAQSLLSPISQAVFPRISNLIKNDIDAGYMLLRKVMPVVLVFYLIISAIIFFLANYLVLAVAGEEYLPAGFVLKILAICPLLIGMSNLFGVQILIASGSNRLILLVATAVACFVILLSDHFIATWQERGAAVLILSAELVVAIIYLWFGFQRLQELRLRRLNEGAA